MTEHSRIPDNRKITLEGEAISENRRDSNDQLNTLRFAQSTAAAAGAAGVASAIGNQIQRLQSTGTVEFDVQPTISESGNTSYFEIGDIRQAANILIYMGSPSREFSINGKFVSRSEKEAARTLKYVRHLRSWRMPEKGASNDVNDVKTPSRLTLKGFGKWYNSIHVRISSLNIEMPEDVDYIRVGDTDVPIVWPVSVTLKETRSEKELREFNIEDFRKGDLIGW